MSQVNNANLYQPIPTNEWTSVRGVDPVQAQWLMVATSYKNAADSLVDTTPDSLLPGAQQVYIACPIVFLYRHFLETALKGLMIDLQALGKQSPRQLSIPAAILDQRIPRHPLIHSWQPVKQLLIELSGHRHAPAHDLREGNAIYKAIEDRIKEFDQIDPNSYSYRYPIDRSTYDRILGPLPNTNQLQHLQEQMATIETFFGGYGLWIHHEREAIMETNRFQNDISTELYSW